MNVKNIVQAIATLLLLLALLWAVPVRAQEDGAPIPVVPDATATATAQATGTTTTVLVNELDEKVVVSCECDPPQTRTVNLPRYRRPRSVRVSGHREGRSFSFSGQRAIATKSWVRSQLLLREVPPLSLTTQAALDSALERIGKLEGRMDAVETDVKGLHKDARTVKNALTRQKERVDNHESRIAALESGRPAPAPGQLGGVDHSEAIKALQDVDTAQAAKLKELEDKQKSQENNPGSNAAVVSQLEELKKQLDELKARPGGQPAVDNSTKIADLQKQIEDEQKKATPDAAKIADLERQVAELEAAQTAPPAVDNTEKFAVIDKRIAALEARPSGTDADNAEITKIRTLIAALSTKTEGKFNWAWLMLGLLAVMVTICGFAQNHLGRRIS